MGDRHAVFRSKGGDRLKLLLWDGTSLVLGYPQRRTSVKISSVLAATDRTGSPIPANSRLPNMRSYATISTRGAEHAPSLKNSRPLVRDYAAHFVWRRCR